MGELADEVVENMPEGAFFESLTRNNKKIKLDRAQNILDDAQTIYKRQIEDMRMDIKKTKRERDNMLDLSPTTTDTLVLASDFDAKQYVDKDIDLGVKIRNLEIKLEIAESRYQFLFGGKVA